MNNPPNIRILQHNLEKGMAATAKLRETAATVSAPAHSRAMDRGYWLCSRSGLGVQPCSYRWGPGGNSRGVYSQTCTWHRCRGTKTSQHFSLRLCPCQHSRRHILYRVNVLSAILAFPKIIGQLKRWVANVQSYRWIRCQCQVPVVGCGRDMLP